VESNDDPGPLNGVLKPNGGRYPVPEFFVEWTDFMNGGDINGQRVAYFPDSTAFRLKLKPERGADSLFTAVLLDKNGEWPENPQDWITWPNDAVTDDPFYQAWGNISYGSTDGAYLVAWNDWRNALLDEWKPQMPGTDIYGQRLWLNPADSALVWIDHAGNRDADPGLNTPIVFLEADEGNRYYPAISSGGKDNSFLVAFQNTINAVNIDIEATLYKGAPAIPTGVDSREPGLAADFTLGLNYPNPFNPDTRIRYSLAEEGRSAEVLMLGRRSRLWSMEQAGRRPCGGVERRAFGWNPGLSGVPYRLEWAKAERRHSGKMVLIR
jgi:hypothetical protein